MNALSIGKQLLDKYVQVTIKAQSLSTRTGPIRGWLYTIDPVSN